MIHRVLTAIVSPLLFTTVLGAADFATYRGFQFGASVAASAKAAKVELVEVRTIHSRPALIQELDWRPVFTYQVDAKKADPVREGVLRFYNGELFQVVITYDRERVEGMTNADMVEAISATYGAGTTPAGEIAYHSNYGETAAVIARWEDADYSANLIRTGDHSSFALILSRKSLDLLARAAIVAAAKLDSDDAPRRALELEKKLAADNRILLDKARLQNRPNFRP